MDVRHHVPTNWPSRRSFGLTPVDGLGYPAELAGEFGTSRGNLPNHLTCSREISIVR
jgi:hypothetical protein